MKKIFSLLLIVFCLYSYADKSAEVEVESKVDAHLNIVRLDSGIVDLFRPSPVRFAIFSNIDKNINLEADSDFKATDVNNNQHYIDYQLAVNVRGTDHTINETNKKIEIERDKFDDNKRLDIDVTATPVDLNKITTLPAGIYKGKYTLKISAVN
ncbi:MAG: hypothetical protein E7015_01915 [Alphaproteobacteria bacterium]|nr:hypothetical protein [Alphaproteobacteria bacterium]